MTGESSHLPYVMRLLGWVLVVMTMLYPWQAINTWHEVRDLVSAEAQALPQGSGMAFNLKTSVIHCGLLGWLGGVGTGLSLVWLIAALVAWVGTKRRHEGPLAPSSRFVVTAVLGAVLVAVGTQQYFERVHGTLII